ncbi:ATP-binding protein [Nocardioides dongxiaopingii]|uniref:ATP-binding protein n=1 Tax=Nocardioides sp. S-1144 TaxID=2582905 RepID=UPI00165293D6|nr:ATP-binding protein [Nocardioides sp. S-1144]
MVDIRPDAAALRMFRSLSFTPWYALGEFVDNSISSYFQNLNRLSDAYGSKYVCDVRISFDDRVGRLVVEDNAAGIAREDLPRALRTGEPPKDTSVGLNLHGVGMKAAAFWWGRHLTIETWPLGEPRGWKVEIDLGESGTQPQANATVRSIQGRKHSGTRITVEGLWQNAPVAGKTRATVAAYLPSIYRKFLSVGEVADIGDGTAHPVRLFLDGTQLSFAPPTLLSEPFWPSPDGPEKGARKRKWRKKVRAKLSTGKVIEGWVGILETMSRELSGFTLHYRGKGIGGVTPLDGIHDSNSGFRPREIFGQSGGYRSQSYIGEFDVTALGKSITTDSTLWTPEEEAEFVDHVLAQMKDPKLDLWSMAVNFKRRKRSQVDKKRLSTASTTAAKDLKKAADGKISHNPPDNDASDLGEDSPAYRFTITDREIHTHSFALRFSTNRTRPFLTVTDDKHCRAHEIVVNEAHPLFDDLPPIDVAMRTLLTRVALSLGAAEVFVESAERNLIRQKMNQILQLVHPEPDDLPEE